MPEVNVCPRASQWLQFVRGESSAEEQDRLVRHLLECRECARSLQHFPVSDSLLSQIQSKASHREGTLTPDLEELLRRHQKTSGLRTPMIGEPDLRTLEEFETDAADPHWARLLQPPTEPGDIGWLGQYRVKRVLGTGGMGRVYLAEDSHLRRPVALKVMSPHLNHLPSARERFLREARSAAAIRDDHIVTIFQVGQVEDTPFLAMELLQGESLEAHLEREPKLSQSQVLRIGREVAEGLAVAHEQGLIHRDIKPANLWLERPASAAPDEPFNRVKLLDFGLARAAEGPTSITGTGQVVGTPHYMSPEQARGDTVDARGDLFSLGCVLYRLAAGREPFEGTSVMAILTALAVQEPRALGEIRPDLSPDIIDLVHRLLQKKPSDRPGSAREVVAAIRGIEQQDQTGLANSPSPGGLSTTSGHGARTGLPAPVTQTLPRFASPLGRRRAIFILAGAFLLAAVGLAYYFLRAPDEELGNAPALPVPHVFTGEPIRVGILHSVSGSMAESGTAVVDATILAIEEINEKGGILGREVKYILRDGQSDPDDFVLETEAFLTEDKVRAIFGCWSSAERKLVLPLVEKHQNLLLYPVQYEGLEQSPNAVYFGMTPNQQLLPALEYAYTRLGRRKFFLVGSDYVYPHAANEIMKEELKSLGATVVGEAYLSLGDTNVQPIIEQIKKANPDMILNTINGDSNRAFFRSLRKAGIKSEKVPTISFSISEPELKSLGNRDMVGDYAAWCYFMSLPDPKNKEFVDKFKDRYGVERVTSDPMLSAYVSVHLWAKAVENAKTDDPVKVRAALAGATFHGPGGQLRVDPKTFHTFQTFRMGQIVEGPTFELVYGSEVLIRPEPFLKSRGREEWEGFLQGLYLKWGNRWDNPGK